MDVYFLDRYSVIGLKSVICVISQTLCKHMSLISMHVLFAVTFFVLSPANADVFNASHHCFFPSLCHKAFYFPSLSEHFLSSLAHFPLWTLVIRLGITTLNKHRFSSIVKCRLSPVESPKPHDWSQAPCVARDLGFSFIGTTLSWKQSWKPHLHPRKVHVWYIIVAGYASEVSFLLLSFAWMWLSRNGSQMVISSCCRYML